MIKKLLFLLFLISSSTYGQTQRTIENPPVDLEQCDDDSDGFGTFDLTQNNAVVIGSQDPSDVVVSYFETQANADSNISAIDTSFLYNNITANIQTLYVRVDELTSGMFEVDSFDIIVLNSPSISAPSNPLELCDDNTDEIAIFDLTSLESSITNGDPLLTVSYYVSQNDLDNDLAIPNPSSYSNVINPQTIQILVTNSEGCTAQTSVILSVQPLPVPANIPAVEACDDDSDGFSEFDLASVAVDIANGEPNVTVSFHETQADADSNQAALATIYTNTSASNQTLYARVTNDISSCYVVITVDLIVNTTIAASPTDLSECDDNGDSMEIFDLTQNDSVVTGSQNSANMTITYFVTLVDAEANANAIASPSSFTNTTNPQTLFIRAENSVTGCSSVASFDIEVDDCSMDADGDGIPDADEDLNGNGNLDDDDTDGDMIPNYQDDDDDGDLVPTQDEIEGIGAGRNAFIDTDTDTIENYLDNDDDGDTILTKDEDYNGNGDPLDDDTNSNNIPDFLEEDVALDVAENVFSVSVYPNPTTGIIVVETLSAFAKAQLYTMTGQLVFSESFRETQRYQKDISNLPSGIYFLHIDNRVTIQISKR
jgi:hypothetical protein